MFKLNEKNSIKYFTSNKLEGLHHAFTTRGLDMRHDDERNILLKGLGFCKTKLETEQNNLPEDYFEGQEPVFETAEQICNLVMPKQEHTANIAIIENEWDTKKDFAAVDGVIITVPNIPVALCFADCVPVILYSKKDNVLAVIHAGWRGTAAGIVKKTCKILIDDMGVKPKNITMAIGACISKNCFEVSEDIKTALEYSLDGDYDDIFFANKADLKKINAYQAMETGIMDIDTMEYCTCDDNDLFYSYRKENETPKRHGVIAQLKEDLG